MTSSIERTVSDPPQHFVLHSLLRTLRMSERDLARKISVSKTTINRWLKGVDKPSEASARKLEAFFGESWSTAQLFAPASVDPTRPDVVVLFRPATEINVECKQCRHKQTVKVL